MSEMRIDYIAKILRVCPETTPAEALLLTSAENIYPFLVFAQHSPVRWPLRN